MTTRSFVPENFNCKVVDHAVTIVVLNVAQTGQRPAKQMKNCSLAHVCKLFGDPPSPSAFSAPARNGCPYHDSLNTTLMANDLRLPL